MQELLGHKGVKTTMIHPTSYKKHSGYPFTIR
jgi:hypothetical protein